MGKNKSNHITGFLLILLFPLPSQAAATYYAWDHGADTMSWFDSANWNPDGQPGTEDIVNLNATNIIADTQEATLAQARIGYSTTGSLTIQNGSVINDALGYVGTNALSVGSVTVKGRGTVWNNTSYLYVGYYGTGTLLVDSSGSIRPDAKVGHFEAARSGLNRTGV